MLPILFNTMAEMFSFRIWQYNKLATILWNETFANYAFFFLWRAWGWGVEHLILHCCSTFSCLAVITLLFKLLIFKEITSSKHWKSRNYLRVDGNFLTTWNNCGTCVKCIFFFVFSTHYLIFRQFTTHLPTYIY